MHGRCFQAFPDAVFHAGGDEVSWSVDAEAKAWMRGYGIQNTTGLNNFYMGRLFGIVHGLGKSPMVWKPGASDLVPESQLPQDLIYDMCEPLTSVLVATEVSIKLFAMPILRNARY